jgi:hypothetical protein
MSEFAAATAEERVAAQMALAGLPLKTFLTNPVIPYERDEATHFPDIARPYVSPAGIPGAVAAIVISMFTLAMLFLNPDYRPGVPGATAWFVCGIAYFALYGRKRLILSPEEEFATAQETRP